MLDRILFISNLYPNKNDLNRGLFNYLQTCALANYYRIDVVAPISFLNYKVQDRAVCNDYNNITVVHPVYYYPPRFWRSSYGWWYYLSILNAIKCMASVNSYKAIFSTWLFPDSWASAKISETLRVPLFVKVHGTDVNNLKHGGRLTGHAMSVIKRANKIICVSNALKEKLLTHGVDGRKLVVIRNGVDKTVFYPMCRRTERERCGVRTGESVILYVGNLKREKGLVELVVALKELVDSQEIASPRLVVIGAGPFRNEMIDLISRLGIMNAVTFLGKRTHEEISSWMNASDVLCLPSYMEGLPNVVMEALSCGIRVVSTTVGGIPELVEEEGLLTLVVPRDSKALAKALMGVIRIGKEGLEPRRSHKVFASWGENARLISDLIESGHRDSPRILLEETDVS